MIYAIYDFAGYKPKFLLALLNSKFFTYYLTQKFKHKHLAGGYIALNKSTIEELPIIKVSAQDEAILSEFADQIIASKKLNPTSY